MISSRPRQHICRCPRSSSTRPISVTFFRMHAFIKNIFHLHSICIVYLLRCSVNINFFTLFLFDLCPEVCRANFMMILSTTNCKPLQFKKMLVLPPFSASALHRKHRWARRMSKRDGNEAAAAGLVFQYLSRALLVPPLVQGLRVPAVSSRYANPNTSYWPPSTHR